jgi:hypothetical protein
VIKKIERLLKNEEKKLKSWFEIGDCDDHSTEEYINGRIEGLKLALNALKGG